MWIPRVCCDAAHLSTVSLSGYLGENLSPKPVAQNNPQSAQGLEAVTYTRCVWINHSHPSLCVSTTRPSWDRMMPAPCQQRKRGNQMESCFCGLWNSRRNNTSKSNGPGWGNETGPRTSPTPNCFLSFCVRPSGPETFGYPPKVNLCVCVCVCVRRESGLGLLVKMQEVYWQNGSCFLKSV